MKILVVQESDWIERGPHQSHHLMERLTQNGDEVRVIDYEINWKKNIDKGLFFKREIFSHIHKAVESGDVTVIRPSFIRMPMFCYFSMYLTHYMEIRRQIDSFKPDVIIGFGLVNANIAIKLGHQHNIPFIYYIIDQLHLLVPEKRLQALAETVEKSNYMHSDEIISINEGLREYTISLGAEQAKTKVIRAGVDLGRFFGVDGSTIRKTYGITDEDVVLFFMGWLYSFSGLDEVALELIKSSESHIKLFILGKGELLGKLKEIKKNDSKNSLIIEDWKPYSEVPKYLAAGDICLLPAKQSEIMKNIVPIKMYEYMAAGKVVFSTDLPGIRKEFGIGHGVMYVNNAKEIIDLARKMMKEKRIKEEGLVGSNFVKSNDWAYTTSSFRFELLNLKEISCGRDSDDVTDLGCGPGAAQDDKITTCQIPK